MLMAFSLLSEGQASTTGLTSTSSRPPPTAYTTTQHSRPTKGSGSAPGSTVNRASPAADRAWARIIDAR